MTRGNDDVREESRKVRIVYKELRQHQQEVEDDKDEAVDCRSNTLQEHFKKAELNFEKLKTVDQALVDAQIFHKLGLYSKRQADQLSSGLRRHDGRTFSDALMGAMMKGRNVEDFEDDTNLALNFKDLGMVVHKRWKRVASIGFMFGLEPRDGDQVVKERKKAKRIQRGKIVSKPNALNAEEVEQTETDRQVAHMRAELERRGSINFWLFVIDPESFTRSVENVFHSSFLIKDKLAMLDLKRKPPMLKYCDPDQRQRSGQSSRGASEPVASSEVIMGFDYNTWLELIKEHNITRCLLPSQRREEPTDAEYKRLQQLGGGASGST